MINTCLVGIQFVNFMKDYFKDTLNMWVFYEHLKRYYQSIMNFSTIIKGMNIANRDYYIALFDLESQLL